MLMFQVRPEKRLRVIIDTDAACEADDPFAIVHALLTPKFIVRGILAEQFGTVRNHDSTEESYQEIRAILDAMNLDVPALVGARAAMEPGAETETNDASTFLIEEAMREADEPLFVLCQGALTNVAIALRQRPEIAGRMTVIWIGGCPYDAQFPLPEDFREFNAGNDVLAANTVLHSGVALWQVPMDVYSTMHTSIAELQRRVQPCGAIGAHLFDQLIKYNATDWAFWTPGESWSLGDSPVVGLAMNPRCGRYTERPALQILPDTRYAPAEDTPIIRVYTSVDARFILEDMFAKLALA